MDIHVIDYHEDGTSYCIITRAVMDLQMKHNVVFEYIHHSRVDMY